MTEEWRAKQLVLCIDLDDTLIHTTSFDWFMMSSSTEYLRKIQDLNVKFHLVTARAPGMEACARVSKIINHISKTYQVTFETTVYTEFQPKGKYAHQLESHFIVDDRSDYIRDCNQFTPSAIPILYGKRPSDVDDIGYSCLAVPNWKELYNIFADYRKQGPISIVNKMKDNYSKLDLSTTKLFLDENNVVDFDYMEVQASITENDIEMDNIDELYEEYSCDRFPTYEVKEIKQVVDPVPVNTSCWWRAYMKIKEYCYWK